MITEKQKSEIHQVINGGYAKLRMKREKLEELRMAGEDKISVFMNPGEVLEVFNDPSLNLRCNQLWDCEKKLNGIQDATSSTILENNVPGDLYLRKTQEIVSGVESEIEKV